MTLQENIDELQRAHEAGEPLNPVLMNNFHAFLPGGYRRRLPPTGERGKLFAAVDEAVKQSGQTTERIAELVTTMRDKRESVDVLLPLMPPIMKILLEQGYSVYDLIG